MEKPHTGLEFCPRILLSCFRARNSDHRNIRGVQIPAEIDMRQELDRMFDPSKVYIHFLSQHPNGVADFDTLLLVKSGLEPTLYFLNMVGEYLRYNIGR